jgi:3-oxoacyl-(acyl-carrier-protein) synthase
VSGPGIQIAARGAVSCFGIGVPSLISSVFDGASGIRPRHRLRDVDCLTNVAAEVPPSLTSGLDRAEDLPLHLATLAAREALESWEGPRDESLHLIVSTTKADLSGITSADGAGLGNPLGLAQRLATALDLRGPVSAISCACASGLAALALAGRRLRRGQCRQVLIVGTDSISPFVLRGFSALLALSPTGCRPFDRGRDGLSLGDGAGALLLTTDPRQDAPLMLTGWGESNDANHITGPSRDGAGLASAMERALSSAGVGAASVDVVHLHGTGTPYNDAMEPKAMARVFAPLPPAAGSKGQIGHTLGAAGILESLVALAALERGTTPPNTGLTEPDPDSALDLQPASRPLPRSHTALKVAAGFGGINAALVFERRGA